MTVNGGYPESRVRPELFAGDGDCRPALPVGEVVEWFDFGQFVELFATDESGASYPLVVTQDDAVLQASLRIRSATGTPTRPVDLAGGVPLSRAAVGEGADAFKAIGVPDEVVVDDVDLMIRSGRVTANGRTYHLTLHSSQAAAVRDGESQLLRARVDDGSGGTSRVWLQLVPRVIDVLLDEPGELDGLLADPVLTVGSGDQERQIRLLLDASEVATLLAGRSEVVRGTSAAGTTLVRIRQNAGVDVGYAVTPSAFDVELTSLPAFLADPVVAGTEGLPFRVPLTATAVTELRSAGSTQVALAGDRVLTLRVKATAG